MENMTNEMKNAAAVADNEIEAAVGGAGILDFLPVGSKAKALNGKVCPKCGHDVGILRHPAPYTPDLVLVCEKCGGAIDGNIFTSDQVILL